MTWQVPQNMVEFDEESVAAVTACLRRGWITEGPEAERFTEHILTITGAKHVVPAPNGTLALYLALRAVGIGPGDEVVVPDLTFIASATAVLMTGATPVFADVDDRGLLALDTLGSVLSARTKAIMPVHLFGFLAPTADSGGNSVLGVEDACQAFGVLPPEQFGEPALRVQAFSFFADKAFTTGEGGAVATSDDALAERMRYIRNQGRLDRGSFAHPRVGINLRMTDLQCALGNVQLRRFVHTKVARVLVWATYADVLDDYYDKVRVLLPPAGQEAMFIPFRVVVRFCKPVAHKVAAVMRRRGIAEPREMFLPLHRQPCFAGTVHGPERQHLTFPSADDLWQHGLLLPCWPQMTREQVHLVVRELMAAYDEASR